MERIVKTTIPPEAEGTRLDLYLAARFTYRSRTAWQECIERGEILLNGRRTRASRLLHAGETVSLELNGPEAEEPPVRTDYSVLLETRDFLAVAKPPDLPVHPSGRYFSNTLQRMLHKAFGTAFPVNRLDRDTSGVVLFARSGAAARRLAELFERGNIAKTYLAIVFGDFPEELSAAGFLSADPASAIAKKRRFTAGPPDGAPESAVCRTEFRLIRRGGGLSLVECRPRTGRLHQIRATLCSLGFPLAGDKMYGPDETVFLRFIAGTETEADRALLRMDRQALHAAKLEFVSPFTGEFLAIEAPPPDDFLLLP